VVAEDTSVRDWVTSVVERPVGEDGMVEDLELSIDELLLNEDNPRL